MQLELGCPVPTTPNFAGGYRYRETDFYLPGGIRSFRHKLPTFVKIQPPFHYIPAASAAF